MMENTENGGQEEEEKKGIHSEYVFVVTQSKRKLLYDVAPDVL